MSIVKDETNHQFKYFLKVRKLATLSSREPKLKLDKDNNANNTIANLEIFN